MLEHHRGIGMTSQRTRERLVARIQERGIADLRVLEAISHVPRHLFVDEALASHAYEDVSLPIGSGQTISQPFTVARMTEAALAGGTCGKVLEVGTGSGYQTAVLSRVCDEVFSVERIETLLSRARGLFHELRLDNIRLRHSDGRDGWPGEAPFDAIVVTAAPTEIPQALLPQLADGGRLVIPLGGTGDSQDLVCVVRNGDAYEQETLEKVSFVPLLEGARR